MKHTLTLGPRQQKDFTFEFREQDLRLWRIATETNDVEVLYMWLGTQIVYCKENTLRPGFCLGALMSQPAEWAGGIVLRVVIQNTRDVDTTFDLEILTEDVQGGIQ